MNFDAGADVNTARRLLQHQQLRLHRHPVCQQHLLLVAATELTYTLSKPAVADVEPPPQLGGGRALLSASHDAKPTELAQDEQHEIALDRQHQHESVSLALGRNIGNSRPTRCQWGRKQGATLPVHPQPAPDIRAQAAESLGKQLGTRSAYAIQTDDLAAAQRQRYARQRRKPVAAPVL